MLRDADGAEWSDNVGSLLYQIAAASESRGDYATTKSIRVVCKAWLSAANGARAIWHPQYGCTSEKVSKLARSFPNLVAVDLSSCLPRAPVDLEPLLRVASLRAFHAGNYALCIPSTSSEALEQLTTLVQLDFCPLGDVTSLKLSQLQQLTTLSVRGPEVYTSPGGPDCYENESVAQHIIQQASSLAQLQSLCLSRLAVSELAWEALRTLSHIRRLSLMEVIHTAYVQQTSKKPEELVNARASEVAFAAVCQLIQLTDLDMQESLVYLRSIKEISRLSLLTNLNFHGVQSVTSLDGLEQVSGLEWFNMSDLVCVSTLAPLQQLTSLRELHFPRCINVQTWGVQAISLLRKLEVIDMHCCAFSSTWITLLTGLTSLRNLNMSVGNWRDQDIVQLTHCSSLSVLKLGDCPSTTSSMHRILMERLPLLKTIKAECSTSGDQYAGFLGWPY